MRPALVAVAGLVAVAAAAASPPRAGLLDPGRSLGGIRLGGTPAAVRRSWGANYGACRHCADLTWYFNFSPFQPEGAGVSFRSRRVAAVFTLWQPRGWRGGGLRLGDRVARVTKRYPRAARVTCEGYYALTVGAGRSRTDFYVVGGRLWGFGLRRPSVPPCR